MANCINSTPRHALTARRHRRSRHTATPHFPMPPMTPYPTAWPGLFESEVSTPSSAPLVRCHDPYSWGYLPYPEPAAIAQASLPSNKSCSMDDVVDLAQSATASGKSDDEPEEYNFDNPHIIERRHTSQEDQTVIPRHRSRSAPACLPSWEQRSEVQTLWSVEDGNMLCTAIEECLMDEMLNPFQGSLPFEKVQNIVQQKCPALHDRVVGDGLAAWKRFVQDQPSLTFFQAKPTKWRLRLTSNVEWQQNDEAAEAEITANVKHLQCALIQHLMTQRNWQCTLDSFMAAYPTLPCNQTASSSSAASDTSSECGLSCSSESEIQPYLPHQEIRGINCGASGSQDGSKFPLPKRGDVARFVKRTNQLFAFNPKKFMIRLKQNAQP